MAKAATLKMAKPLKLETQTRLAASIRKTNDREKQFCSKMRQALKQEEQAARSKFMALPAEIRLMVYRELLVRDEPGRLDGLEYDWSNNPDVYGRRYAVVLRVSKQIYKEALPVLYQENEIETSADLPYLGVIGLKGCALLKSLTITALVKENYGFKGKTFEAWDTMCKSCEGLEKIKVDIELWGFTEIRCFWSLVAHSMVTARCAVSFVPSIELRIRINDCYDEDSTKALKQGLKLARDNQDDEWCLRMWHPLRITRLQSIQICTELDKPSLTKVRKDIRRFHDGDHEWVCTNSDRDWDDIRDDSEFNFEWKLKGGNKRS